MDKKNGAAYLNRGISRVQIKDREGARVDFKKFLELTLEQQDSSTIKARERIFSEFPELK